MKSAQIYLHASRDTMFELGTKLGFKDDALRKFSFGLSDVRIEIKAQPDGTVNIFAVDGMTLFNNRKQELEIAISGHMEAMRPLLKEWTKINENNN